MKVRRTFVCVLTIVGIPVAALAMMSLLSQRPPELGVTDGHLAECPSSPNCVSTQAADPQRRLEPIPYHGSADKAMDRLKQIIGSMPRTRIITADGTYLHAEFRSLLFRFVDDVEFLIDADAHEIQFRSASRAGYSDLGVNRRRMQAIRSAFAQTASDDVE